MFTHPLGRLGKVAALARPVDHEVRCGAVGLAGDLGLAIGQQLDVASEHHRYGFLDPAVDRLRQRGFGTLGNLADRLTPGPASGILKVRCRNLFPGELFYCYHDIDLHRARWWLLDLAAW